MTDNDSPDDLFQGKTQTSSKDNSVPPLQVFNETKYLDDKLGRVLLAIYEREEVTVQDLSVELDRPESHIKRQVSELRKQGYLSVDYEADTKRYFVRSDWGTQEFPSGPIIPLVYQFNLLSDTQRMEALHKAIKTTVDTGDIVADLGAGVGGISCMAARYGKKVHAVEIDREVYEQGRQVVEQAGLDNIEYLRADAREVDLPAETDVIMCEMLDTGLIAELQVPVMNHAIEQLGENVQTIPIRAKTGMRLIQTDYEFYNTEFRLPHFEEYNSRKSEPRSEREDYHKITFTEQNSELVEEEVTVEATEAGIVNGTQLQTHIQFAPGMDYTGASPWLNPPLNLPFEEDYPVSVGDEITVSISYELGGGLQNIVYRVSNR